MHEFDDVKGSTRTIEQRNDSKHALPELSHLPDHQSFDVEFSPSGLVLLLVTRARSGTIHHSERFFYTDGGELQRTVSVNGAGVETDSTTFSREVDGRRVSKARDADGKLIATGIDEYSSGLLVRASSFRGEVISARKTIEYVDRKAARRISEFYGFNGGLSETWITRFDREGRTAETFGLKPDGQPLGDGRYLYEYDASGRKYRVVSFNDLADDDVPNRIQGFTYTCDEAGNWTERCEYSRFRGDAQWRESVVTRRIIYYS